MLNIHTKEKMSYYSVSLNHLCYQNLMSSEIDTIPTLQVIKTILLVTYIICIKELRN